LIEISIFHVFYRQSKIHAISIIESDAIKYFCYILVVEPFHYFIFRFCILLIDRTFQNKFIISLKKIFQQMYLKYKDSSPFGSFTSHKSLSTFVLSWLSFRRNSYLPAKNVIAFDSRITLASSE